MASRYEVEVTIGSARDLKNVNWRYGDLKPYAVVWIDPAAKCSTKVDVDGDVNPAWDEKLTIPLPYDRRIEDSTLYIDIVHARSNSEDDTKPLIGSARLPLREVVEDVGIGSKLSRTLKLKRPSGRPQGKLEVKIALKEPTRYYDPSAPPYGQPTPREIRDPYGYERPYAAPPAGYPYGGPPAPPPGSGYGYGAPPPTTAGPGYGYGAPPPTTAGPGYGYGAPPPVYGASSYGTTSYGGAPVEEKKKSKFGMGTGLAVGAAAGILGGLALAEGVDYVEDKIADEAAEKVEDRLAYDGYDDGGYDDF